MYLVYPIVIMAWACPGMPYTICMLEIEKCTWRGTPMYGEIKGCRKIVIFVYTNLFERGDTDLTPEKDFATLSPSLAEILRYLVTYKFS